MASNMNLKEFTLAVGIGKRFHGILHFMQN